MTKKNQRHSNRAGRAPRPLCQAVRPLLFEYMSRELPNAQAALVREHLRGCAACAAEAAEIERTLSLLKNSDPAPELAFEPRRRAKMLWLMEHPLVAWFFLHRRITGVLCAIIAMAAVCFALMLVKRRELLRDGEIPVKVNISQPILFMQRPEPDLPPLPELEDPPFGD